MYDKDRGKGDGAVILRDRIIRDLDSIPSLPTAAIKTIRLLQDTEVSIAELARTIEYDPSLTTNLLHLANSAYFGASRQIDSVRQAIIRLGTNNLFRLVVASAVVPLAHQPVRGYDLSAGELWIHSIAVALCSDLMRAELGLSTPSFMFTSALLHNIGKVVLGNCEYVEPQKILDMAVSHNVSFDEAELAVLGIDHAEVGALLLDRWNFPQNIIEVVRWHHYPNNYPDEKIVIDLVHVSDNLCMKTGIGIGVDGLKHRVSQESLSRLKLSTDIAEHVLIGTMENLSDFRNMLN